MRFKSILAIFFLFCLNAGAMAASYFEDGEKLYTDNKPVEALPLLLEALTLDPTNEQIYIYLGTIYEQLGDYENAFVYLKKGLNYANRYKDKFYYNLGNNYFMREQFIPAEEMFTKAIIENPTFAKPYLNRANSRLNQQKYNSTLIDLKKYLQLYPMTPQRSEIEALIAALTDMLEEEDRIKREQIEKDKNLQDLLNKLQNASDNIKNLSAGNETPEENYENDDILD